MELPYDEQSREAYYMAGILHWALIHDQENFFPHDLTSWRSGGSYDFESENYLGDEALRFRALEALVDVGAIAKVPDRYGPTIYVLKGTSTLDKLASEFGDSPFARTRLFGTNWLKQALTAVTIDRPKEIERSREELVVDALASSDDWEPLPLDRRDSAVDEAIEHLSDAVRKVGADNGFASAMPAERENLLLHAEATIQSARTGKISRQQVMHNLILAGKWLGEKFAGSVLGTLGGELVKWGLRLLGLTT